MIDEVRVGRGIPRAVFTTRAFRASLLVLGTILLFRAISVRSPYVASYSREDYDRACRELVAATSAHGRYDALANAAKTSVYFGSLDVAQDHADELLELSERLQRSWNYGNAIHDGHLVRGLVALRRGAVDDAGHELRLAGGTPGSPQLDTFGPNMLLAKELLEHGERDVVVEYLDLCRRFWKMHRGRLDQWMNDARQGRTPDFGANLVF